MGNISETMKGKEDMLNISGVMRDMSFEMRRMSEMMGKGTATDNEINTMRDSIMEMKKRMSEIKQ